MTVRFLAILNIRAKSIRRLFFAMLLLTPLLAGCAQGAPSQPSGQSPTSVEATAATPTLPLSTPTALKPTVSKSSPPSLALKVTTPQDESTVNVASIPIVGQTIVGAVVSVNGNLVDVDASGKFQTTVKLDEGPNIIQVVASDVNGNELSAILRVIYEP